MQSVGIHNAHTNGHDPYMFTQDAAAVDRLQTVMDDIAPPVQPNTQINLTSESGLSGSPAVEALAGTIAQLADLANDLADFLGADAPVVASLLDAINELQVLLESMVNESSAQFVKSNSASDFSSYDEEFPVN